MLNIHFSTSILLNQFHIQYPRVPNTSEQRSELRSCDYALFLDGLSDEEYHALEAEGGLGNEDGEAGGEMRMDADIGAEGETGVIVNGGDEDEPRVNGADDTEWK